MRLQHSTRLLLLALLLPALVVPPRVHAQSTPEELCRQGVAAFDEAARLASQDQDEASRTRYDEALQLLEQSFALRAEITSGTIAGRCAFTLGQLRPTAEGKFEAYSTAVESLRQAEPEDRAGNRPYELEALINIAQFHFEREQYAESLVALDQAEPLTDVGEALDVAIIKVWNRQGIIYNRFGRFTEALGVFDQSLSLISQLKYREWEVTANLGLVDWMQSEELTALIGAGKALSELDRYGEALERLEQARTIDEFSEAQARKWEILSYMGSVYSEQGRISHSIGAYEEALELVQGTGRPLTEANYLDNLGIAQFTAMRYDEALEHNEQAISIYRQYGRKGDLAIALDNRGSILSHLGRFDEALVVQAEALTLFKELGLRSNYGIALSNGAVALYNTGNVEKALLALQEATSIAQEVGSVYSEGLAHINTAQLYHSIGQPERALEAYQHAMDSLETVRAGAGSEYGRTAFAHRTAGIYSEATFLAHQQGQDELAFAIAERGRSRAFFDSLATGQLQLYDQSAEDLLTRAQATYARREQLRQALNEAHAIGDQTRVEALQAELEAADGRLEEIRQEIATRQDQLVDLIPGRRQGMVDVQALQARLDEHTTLVAYHVALGGSLAFVLTHERLQVFALPASFEELGQAVMTLRSFPSLSEPHPAPALELYNQLIAPIKDALTTPNLIIVPHGPLHYLPFAALSDGKEHLIERYTVTLLPGASALLYPERQAVVKGDQALVMAYPGGPGVPRLAFAEQEARSVADLLGTEAIVDGAATETALRRAATSAGVIHLATHGQYDLEQLLMSRVALAPDEATDGALTALEIYDLDLRRTDLVVLSACKTQVNELGERYIVTQGDELVGLTRALFFSGVSTVVATLWSVDDQATSLLVEQFYLGLGAGKSKAEALRDAQLAVRKNYPSPYYWSGLVLNGDGGPLQGVSIVPKPEGRDSAAGDLATPTLRLTLLVGSSLSLLIGVVGLIVVALRRRR